MLLIIIGEVLALRWADIENGAVTICRSLSQTKAGLAFKATNTDTPRVVALPQFALKALKVPKIAQRSFKQEFGAAYKGDLDLVFANRDPVQAGFNFLVCLAAVRWRATLTFIRL